MVPRIFGRKSWMGWVEDRHQMAEYEIRTGMGWAGRGGTCHIGSVGIGRAWERVGG
jgi:hypothetical protein